MNKGKIAALALGAGALVAGLALMIAAFYPEDSATAKANFCDSLNNLSSTVMSYQGLNPATATNDGSSRSSASG